MSGTRYHCETCAWWAANVSTDSAHAECRKRAPIRLTNGRSARWPVTGFDDWCGEWREQSE